MNTTCGVPTTIEELQAYCQHHNLPLADMRVFLGEDYRGAKAFGIYRDQATGHVVVYKNKADGTRAVRYEGPDEAYGVHELYLKIKERVALQKRHLPPRGRGSSGRARSRPASGLRVQLLIILIIALATVLAAWFSPTRPSRGYYAYEDHFYYYDHPGWYEWDTDDEAWSPVQADDWLVENADDYYQSQSWRANYEAGDFTDSPWYSEEEDDDQDYDWDDGDSWDDSYDDWDSDW